MRVCENGCYGVLEKWVFLRWCLDDLVLFKCMVVVGVNYENFES